MKDRKNDRFVALCTKEEKESFFEMCAETDQNPSELIRNFCNRETAEWAKVKAEIALNKIEEAVK